MSESLGESGLVYPVFPEERRYFPASDFDAEPQPSLSQISFAMGILGRNPDHGGHGDQVEDDDPDVGQSEFAEVLE